MNMQRVQILLTQEQTRRLKTLARDRRTTLSALVREMVEQGLTQAGHQRQQRRRQVLRRLQTHCKRLLQYGVDFGYTPEVLHHLREERLHDLTHGA